MEQKNCKYCGKPFILLRRNNREFCRPACATAGWQRAHREEWNTKMRIVNKKSSDAIKKSREEKGLCYICGKPKGNTFKRDCQECLNKRHAYDKARRLKNRPSPQETQAKGNLPISSVEELNNSEYAKKGLLEHNPEDKI